MKCIWEHNGTDTLLHAVEYTGAYTRGASLNAAIAKMPAEIAAYSRWSNLPNESTFQVEIIEEKDSDLQIADADSDILFEAEKAPLTLDEYLALKALALKSAEDFFTLYISVPDKHQSCLPKRRTFYGAVPRTAQEMYEHTKNVNAYYFGEIGIDAGNEGTIYACRKTGFELLERKEGYLENPVFLGSYGELWSLRKVCRRFLWHDRIHAKAMYRMALKTFGAKCIENPFCFSNEIINPSAK